MIVISQINQALCVLVSLWSQFISYFIIIIIYFFLGGGGGGGGRIPVLTLSTPCKILPPATPPFRSSTSQPGLFTSNDRITETQEQSYINWGEITCHL